jgi:hypothetical protein
MPMWSTLRRADYLPDRAPGPQRMLQSPKSRRRVARRDRQARSVSQPATVPTMCLRENGPLGDGP